MMRRVMICLWAIVKIVFYSLCFVVGIAVVLLSLAVMGVVGRAARVAACVERRGRMRRWRWVGVLGLGLLIGGCAGANEPPTTADLIFPIPWVLKQPRPLAPVPAEAPAEKAPEGRSY